MVWHSGAGSLTYHRKDKHWTTLSQLWCPHTWCILRVLHHWRLVPFRHNQLRGCMCACFHQIQKRTHTTHVWQCKWSVSTMMSMCVLKYGRIYAPLQYQKAKSWAQARQSWKSVVNHCCYVGRNKMHDSVRVSFTYVLSYIWQSLNIHKLVHAGWTMRTMM